MASYNGHRSWNAWNVSLWINNEEPLYRLAQQCCRRSRTLAAATHELMQFLPTKTPDGAEYNATCVQLAIADIWRETKKDK